ncbi:MAG: hypothetical protein ACI4TG_05495, partial [Ruminococcus sp.]
PDGSDKFSQRNPKMDFRAFAGGDQTVSLRENVFLGKPFPNRPANTLLCSPDCLFKFAAVSHP